MTIEEQRIANDASLKLRRSAALRLHERAIMRPDQQALMDGIKRLVERHQEGTVCEGGLYRRIVALHFLHSKKYHR